MIPGTRTADGSLLINTTTPNGAQVFNGGVALDTNTGAVFVMNGTGPVYQGGLRFTNVGQLCIAPGGVIDHYVNGLPVNIDGRLVTQLNQPVSPGDAFVGGIRVGPLGGVYTSDITPPPPTGFSSGFSNGFGA